MLAAAGAALTVALGGCGASQTIGSVLNPVARAAEVSTGAPGFRFRMSTTVLTAAGQVTGQTTGSFSTARRLGALVTRATAAGHSATVDAVIDGQIAYISTAGQAAMAKLAGGKPWASYDVAKLKAATGSASLPGQGSSNPAQILGVLRAGGHVTRIGSATVDGVATIGYHGVIDLGRYAHLVAAGQRADAVNAVTNLEALLGGSTLSVDVWIDADHLVRRERMSLRGCIDGQHVATTVTLDLYDYGPQPAVRIPPAAQTADITSVIAAGSRLPAVACS